MSLLALVLILLFPVVSLADSGPEPSELARLLAGDDEGFA